MRLRWMAAIALVAAGLSGATVTAHADPPKIAAGVHAAGVDLSGLTVADAAARLTQQLGAPLAAPVKVTVGPAAFVLNPAEAQVRFDADRTAQRALEAGAKRPPGTPADVPLAVSFSRPVVHAFAERVSTKTGRPARDARLRMTVRRMIRRRARNGFGVDPKALAKQLAQTLRDPRLPRALAPGFVRLVPDVTAKDLKRKFATVITIDRGHFKLRLFKRLRRVKSYRIAVGRAGLETPRGRFHVQEKEKNPAWHVPNRPWAGALAGHTVPGGAPGNPLKARWLGLGGGVGIHGTAEDFSIGSRASHGCIRMHVREVIKLYAHTPLGTPVLIR